MIDFEENTEDSEKAGGDEEFSDTVQMKKKRLFVIEELNSLLNGAEIESKVQNQLFNLF